jgi:alcohol dehydrogenase class IV
MQKVFINQGLEPFKKILFKLKVKKVFIVIGNNSFSAIEKIIYQYIKKIEACFFTVGDLSVESAILGCEKLKITNPDLVIAIGGGRIIDVAKIISTASFSSGNYKNIINGTKKITTKFAPLLVMPTTAGTGSEATSFSVMYINNKKYSIVSEKLLPDYIIADIFLIKGMPDYLKACTVFDAFSQSIESFWSIGSTLISEKYAKEAILLISKNIKKYFKESNQNATKNIVYASYLSGRAINISKTTLPHALSYFFSKNYNIPHGHAVALTLGFAARNNILFGGVELKKNMDSLAALLEIDIRDFENYWRDLMKYCGLEVKLSALGVKRGDLKKIVDSVNIERLKNHPLSLEKKELIIELEKIL